MSSKIEIIEPSGVFNANQGNELRREVNDLVNTGVKIVLIDMKNVNFIDSSGLGALVLAMQIIKKANSQLFICSINDQVRMIFELTKMDRILQIIKNREELQQQILAPQSAIS